MTLILPQRGRLVTSSTTNIQTAYGPFSTTNYLRNTVSVPSVTPLTMACWATSTGSPNHAMGLGQSGSGNNRQSLDAFGSQTRAQSRTTSNSTAAETGSFPTNGSWQHICAVFASATDRRVFRNGANKGTNTASRTPGTPTVMTIGVAPRPEFPWPTGYICHAAFWTVALSDAEVLELAEGALPSDVQPGNLHSYLPMTTSPAENLGPSGSWSEIGTITSTADVVGPLYY